MIAVSALSSDDGMMISPELWPCFAETLTSMRPMRPAKGAWMRLYDKVIGIYNIESDVVGAFGETRYCITLSIGFIRYDVWVALPSAPDEGAPHEVLVQPGARLALVFDRFGSGHVGTLERR